MKGEQWRTCRFALLRGDHELNETKALKYANIAIPLKKATDKQINDLFSGKSANASYASGNTENNITKKKQNELAKQSYE